MKDFFVIAHNIRSLHNVGSIFRTSDAFGVKKLFLTGYTGRPDKPNNEPKISKAAIGAEKFVNWEYQKSPKLVLKKLKIEHPKLLVVGLENNVKATSLLKFKPRFPLVLILGEEVGGIKESILKDCDKIIEIPMYGKKESLNVSVAYGVACFTLVSTR